MTEKKKAVNKLRDMDFSGEGSAVALVGPAVGGPANSKTTLLYKSVAVKRSPEFVKKAQQVQVTLELPEFLDKFFNVWGTDAHVLAQMFGYVEPEDSYYKTDDWYSDYIDTKVKAFKIVKSLHAAPNLAEALINLSEAEHLSVLEAQALLEPYIDKVEKAKNESALDSKPNKETKMETVDKAEFEKVQKALETQAAALAEAQSVIKAFEADRKEAVKKSKVDAIKAVLKDEKIADAIAKAFDLENEETFTAGVAAIKSLQDLVEKSALFVETGTTVTDTEDKKEEKSGVFKALEAKGIFASKE